MVVTIIGTADQVTITIELIAICTLYIHLFSLIIFQFIIDIEVSFLCCMSFLFTKVDNNEQTQATKQSYVQKLQELFAVYCSWKLLT